MKHFFCLIAICSFALILPSCRQEVVAPEQQITGRYALDDGSGATNKFLEFFSGNLSIYGSNTSYPLAEGKIWDCDEEYFKVNKYGDYSITDGVLVSSWADFGKVELSNGKLHVGADIYSELKGFTNEYYSVIHPSKDRLDLTYAAETVELAVNVENALPAWSLRAETKVPWIFGLKVENNILKFKTRSTATDRTGVIELKYPHAETVALSVSQKPSTFIKPASETMTFGYEASSQTLGYTIENPISGSSLNATTLALWISDIQISDTQISFKLSENNSGADRSSSFSLSYGGAPNVIVPVTQAWSASSFTLTPTSQETAYTGGSFSFDFAVNNPRADVNVVAASQANWITDVVVSGNKVTYKVSENNSRAQRSGRIRLTYGSYATSEFTVMQIGKPVTSLSLNKSSLALHPGNSEKLVATVEPSDATLTWSSSDTSVATASSDGTVTAKGNGTATITVSATDGSGKNAKCTVTVMTLVSSITLDKTSLSLYSGDSYVLTATVLPSTASNKALTWTSSDPSVATVDAEGKVTAVSKGTATIKAEAKDGSGKYASCSVTVKRPVSSIQLNKTSIAIYNGKTEALIATVIPSDASNTAVTWTSSNTSVATVSSSGVVTGKSRGTATITVTANDGNGAQASCEVEVKQYVTIISLDKTSLPLAIGDEVTLSVTILPYNANDKTYTWSSSDSAIASVDNSGKVTAKAKGKATIKATANDGSGVFASCSVIVFAEKVDMGIKTSDGKTLYWSTRNLCESGFVNSPEDYGDYYAWGETEPKENYSWSTYKWCNGSYSTLSKYNTNSSYGTIDNKTVLEPSDDVASVKLGGKWRMPTDAEWTELWINCTWTWTTNYNGTGVKGRIVTATNGNSIFLPAAGCYRYDTNLYYVGSHGGYWSSSLRTDYPSGAWGVYFDSADVARGYDNRFSGQSVRPVSE